MRGGGGEAADAALERVERDLEVLNPDTNICTYKYANTYTYIYIYTYICTYVSICICLYVHVYIYIHVNIFIHMYTYVHINLLRPKPTPRHNFIWCGERVGWEAAGAALERAERDLEVLNPDILYLYICICIYLYTYIYVYI